MEKRKTERFDPSTSTSTSLSDRSAQRPATGCGNSFSLAPDFSRVEKEGTPPIFNGFNRFSLAYANIPPVSPLFERGEKPQLNLESGFFSPSPFQKGKGPGDRDIEAHRAPRYNPGTLIHSETHNDFLLFENDLHSVSEHSVTGEERRSSISKPVSERRTELAECVFFRTRVLNLSLKIIVCGKMYRGAAWKCCTDIINQENRGNKSCLTQN
jgi:hypothetical protein